MGEQVKKVVINEIKTKIMERKKLFQLAFVVLLVFSISSCIDCIRGDGDIITQNRTNEISEFDQLELSGSFNVEYVQDSSLFLEIEGDSNILDILTTSVSGGRLYIGTKHNRCYSSRNNISVRVHSEKLSKIILSGSGNIRCSSLNTDILELISSGSGNFKFSNLNTQILNANISGSGNIRLGGFAENTSFSISGSGNIYAYDLEQEACGLSINGSGNVYVRFLNSLTGVINGSGNVYYKGPGNEVDIQINGSGRLIKTD